MFKNKLLIIITLMAFSSMTFAQCDYPKKNFDIPTGKNNTNEEMMEVLGKFKQFQSDLEIYRNCLDDELSRISTDLENYPDIKKMSDDKYDAAVLFEQQLGEEMNSAIREYNKAKKK